uniref:HEAT repeat-containing protein 6 n=2 Tax=Clastoptera arizonana TaxID=38151 RepID=A0A1B6CV30_9HEMI
MATYKFDDIISKFSSIINGRSSGDKQKINAILDEINATDFKTFKITNENKEALILNQCFTLISPSNTFLVAKCCHLVLNLVGKLGVKLEDQTLNLAVNWCLESLKLSADVALLDILQALEAIIETSVLKISNIERLITVLSEPIEDHASLTTPLEVKNWRVRCLKAIAPTISLELSNSYCTCLFKLFDTTDFKPDDLNSHSQILKCSVEALQTLCTSCPEWLSKHLGEVLGVSMAYIHFGLANWRSKTVEKLLPSPGAQWEPVANPVVKTHLKKRKLFKLKDTDEVPEEKSTSHLIPFDLNSMKWTTSDSDMSDSDDGKASRLRRNQAKLRLAAVNLLLLVAKIIEIRELFGYYCTLLGKQGLAYSIVHEPNPKVIASVSSTICVLLFLAKAYLAQAQHIEMVSYTPFSAILASLLTSLHQSVVVAFSSATPLPVLNCAAFLVDVTPYHRLQPNLLTKLVEIALPFIKHKDVYLNLGVLKLLETVIAIEPKTEEQKKILMSIPSLNINLPSTPSDCWLFNLAIKNLSYDLQIPLHLEWWQVISNLIFHHFDIIRNHINVIKSVMLRDFETKPELVQIHTGRVLQRMAAVLAGKDDMQDETLDLWTTLLRGPMHLLLGVSPFLSAVVCDCLSNLGPATFTQLSEDLQIHSITMLFGCCRHDDSSVRSAAVQALAKFILCPALSKEEQFIYDSSEIIKELVSDANLNVAMKAAWALGNLTDVLLKIRDEVEMLPPINLIDISLTVAQGHTKVRANGVRALGNLMGLINKTHLSQPSYKNVLVSVATSLAQNAVSINNTKVKWNACYAIKSMLKNEDLHETSNTWQGILYNAINGLVSKSHNFKVRANASSAISSVSKREHYGSYFIPTWTALLDGLENATNMTDFKEFQHQDGLLEQLCIGLCHLAILTNVQDLANLYDVLVFRMDLAKQHVTQFHASTVPERTDIVLKATNHITELIQNSNLSSNQKTVADILIDIFNVGLT